MNPLREGLVCGTTQCAQALSIGPLAHKFETAEYHQWRGTDLVFNTSKDNRGYHGVQVELSKSLIPDQMACLDNLSLYS